jgi:membrane-bound ClpP family serine protease
LLTPLVAVIVGVLVAGGMYALVYYMIFKSQASTQTNLDEMVGLDGLVTVAIKDKEPGQVVVNTEKRGRIPVAATAKGEIESNTPVKVIGIAGDALIVERVKEG